MQAPVRTCVQESKLPYLARFKGDQTPRLNGNLQYDLELGKTRFGIKNNCRDMPMTQTERESVRSKTLEKYNGNLRAAGSRQGRHQLSVKYGGEIRLPRQPKSAYTMTVILGSDGNDPIRMLNDSRHITDP